MDHPHLSSAAAFPKHFGDVVHLVGTYKVQHLRGHVVMVKNPDGTLRKATEVVNLWLDDDTIVDLDVRPDDEMAQWDEKRVVVTGTLLPPDDYGDEEDDEEDEVFADSDSMPSLYRIQRVEAFTR